MQRAPEKEARTIGALQTQADKTLQSAGSSWPTKANVAAPGLPESARGTGSQGS